MKPSKMVLVRTCFRANALWLALCALSVCLVSFISGSSLIKADPVPATMALTSATPQDSPKGQIEVKQHQGGGTHTPTEETITEYWDGHKWVQGEGGTSTIPEAIQYAIDQAISNGEDPGAEERSPTYEGGVVEAKVDVPTLVNDIEHIVVSSKDDSGDRLEVKLQVTFQAVVEKVYTVTWTNKGMHLFWEASLSFTDASGHAKFRAWTRPPYSNDQRQAWDPDDEEDPIMMGEHDGGKFPVILNYDPTNPVDVWNETTEGTKLHEVTASFSAKSTAFQTPTVTENMLDAGYYTHTCYVAALIQLDHRVERPDDTLRSSSKTVEWQLNNWRLGVSVTTEAP